MWQEKFSPGFQSIYNNGCQALPAILILTYADALREIRLIVTNADTLRESSYCNKSCHAKRGSFYIQPSFYLSVIAVTPDMRHSLYQPVSYPLSPAVPDGI